MKTNRGLVGWVLATALLLPGVANATLLSRLGGAAYYDDVLGITWLANANLAASNTFGLTQSPTPAAGEVGSTGQMTWDTANSWVTAMNTAAYLGFSDWRLPTLGPINGSAFQTGFSTNATTDLGYAKTGASGGWRNGAGTPVSEMGYMYYVNLANLGFCIPNDVAPASCANQSGFGLTNTGPFSNLQSGFYWSGLEFAPNPSSFAWRFGFNVGVQSGSPKGNQLFAWAVRSGDVAAVPEPGS